MLSTDKEGKMSRNYSRLATETASEDIFSGTKQTFSQSSGADVCVKYQISHNKVTP